MIQPDPNMHGRFYLHAVKVDGKWKNVLYIEIRARGQKHSSFSKSLADEKVLEEYKLRFPRAWKEYNQEDLPVDGTLLSELPQSSPALIHQLKELEIHTIEQLAEAQDAAVHDIRDGYKYRKAAQVYLASIEAFNEAPAEVIENFKPNSEPVIRSGIKEDLTAPPEKKKAKKKAKKQTAKKRKAS